MTKIKTSPSLIALAPNANLLLQSCSNHPCPHIHNLFLFCKAMKPGLLYMIPRPLLRLPSILIRLIIPNETLDHKAPTLVLRHTILTLKARAFILNKQNPPNHSSAPPQNSSGARISTCQICGDMKLFDVGTGLTKHIKTLTSLKL